MNIVSDEFCIVVQNNVTAEITLTLLSEKSHIQIYSHNNVDLTVRVIILFPEVVDLQISVFLCGEQSRVNVLGMYALAQMQSVEVVTQQFHCGRNNYSRLILQGLLIGQSKVKHNGTIKIEKNASGTYALQNNKNILLSNKSSAISIPNIEVLNHDVQCFHGACVGKFGQKEMQYMQSRGLSDGIIKQLLVEALFSDVLFNYENKNLILKKVYEEI